MTSRIYYTDPYCRRFDAVVTKAFAHEGRPAVLLDRTAFYPTSGGQPFDVGRLGTIDVIDAIEVDDDVAHVLSAPLTSGAAVSGEIDWARRFDHMQQHTGQHVLSAAFDRLFDNRTVSFHMGAELSTIDLAKEMTWEQMARAEDEANRIICENREVAIRFVSPEEASTLPLRKEPARGGVLRLIDVKDFDLSACGGTHVARTGAIGAILVPAVEKFKGGVRVTFVCGGRALRVFRTLRESVAGSVRALSVLPHELPGAIERMQAEAKDLRRAIKKFQESLASQEGIRLAGEAGTAGGVVVEALDGWDANGLKTIASAITARTSAVVALFSISSPIAVVIARSADRALDASAVLRALTARFGGRGGGRGELAQGGGLAGSLAEICDAARELLTSD
ncbi:MAG: phosphoesterase [Acidobacteria bacterium]|nr:MAG: phosphoesterase [Acidobacteriota bacterium]